VRERSRLQDLDQLRIGLLAVVGRHVAIGRCGKVR
jgi:septum formation topological specificity factor MinE